MTIFRTVAEAEAAGFTLQHIDDEHRFVWFLGEREVGEAHYTLLGEAGITFDHTVVHPEFRGTGLSLLLANEALTSEIARARTIHATCWFIAKYLREHPEVLSGQPNDTPASTEPKEREPEATAG